jgi:hypothetical protein
VTAIAHVGPDTLHWSAVVGAVVVVNRQPKLLEVIAAAHPASRFPCRLNGGQQQANQDADDCDNNQKLDQRKTALPASL